MQPFEIPYRSLFVGGLSCFAMCVTILATQHWHGSFSTDKTVGVQKVHDQPIPRVGGLAIMVGLIMATLSAPNTEMFHLLVAMLLASIPAFISGIFEDLSNRVGPMVRLWAAIASGVMAWWLTGYALTRVDIWGVDWLLQWLPISVIFTAFAVAGVANALNMIDGLNGLAGGVTLIAMAALTIIAHHFGDSTLAKLSFVMGVTVLGFLVLNFPFGKLFLGDGGAYLLGFMGAWLAVMLPIRNPIISVWAPLLVFSYPILEVLFSILRRHLRAHNPCHPDRLHLHSLIYARLFRSFTKDWSKPLQNSFASLLPLCLMALGSMLAVLFAGSTLILMACFVLMAVVYAVAYLYIIRFGHWRRLNPHHA
jgi:UDP-N-acetylmuramyl pentapeptide phosphotransferase/UDP-N-acetylglucosamine-1-phosphate transferase